MGCIEDIIRLQKQFQQAMNKLEREEIKYKQDLKVIISLCLASRIFENIKSIIILLKEGNLESSIYPIIRNSLEALIDLDNLLEVEGYDEYLCYLRTISLIKLGEKKTFKNIAKKNQYNFEEEMKLHKKKAEFLKNNLIDKYGNRYKCIKYNKTLQKYVADIQNSIYFKFKLAESITTYDIAYFYLYDESHNGIDSLETKHMEGFQVKLFQKMSDEAISEVVVKVELMLLDTIERIYKISKKEREEIF